MGQGNSQRKVQHQDVALWELYEEDGRNVGRNGRDRGYGRSRNTGRNAGGSKRNRNVGRSVEGSSRNGNVGRSVEGGSRNGNVGRSVEGGSRNGNIVRGGVRIDERGGVRRNTDSRSIYNEGNGGDRRRADGPSRTGSGRMVKVYGQEQGEARIRTAGTADRRPGGAGRRPENAARVRSAGRPGDASRIGYIQPYPDARERRGNPAYAYRGSARPVQSIRRRRARRRRELLCKMSIVLLMAVCLVMIYCITGQIYRMLHRNEQDRADADIPAMAEQVFDDGSKIAPPEMTQNLLEINEYSRPGTSLDRINSIFVHYTANPGTSAAQNRSYFANLAETHERSASAHLIIGYEGELIQCIPFDEQAYAVMTRNEDSISIECCYLSEDGSFTQETYDTLVHTLAWLLDEYGLSTEDILRHYDCGGKLCPLYYAENEGAWERLLEDVAAYMAEAYNT